MCQTLWASPRAGIPPGKSVWPARNSLGTETLRTYPRISGVVASERTRERGNLPQGPFYSLARRLLRASTPSQRHRAGVFWIFRIDS